MSENVVTTASGLQYVDLVAGTGPVPAVGATVRVHYTGWLEDGTKFDRSLDRGEPLAFPIGRGRVIKGWDEGVGTTAEDLDLSGSVELIALSVKERAARCRLLGSDRRITLRASRFWDVVPGEIVTVKPRKQWSYAGHPYLSGAIESTRLEVGALGLVPLRLEDTGTWNPCEHYWGKENEPIGEWAKPIIARGPRPEFEMEQVLPGEDPDDPFADPKNGEA